MATWHQSQCNYTPTTTPLLSAATLLPPPSGICTSQLNTWLHLIPCCYYHHLSTCYRCLGPPTFFPHPILSTVPLPMEHDNQRWRDLLGDLGPVCRWWCSKYCLLKGWVYHLSFHFLFTLGLIYIIISLIAPCTASHRHAYTLVSAQLTHPSLLIIMLTSICHFCLPLWTLPPWLCSLYA